MASERATLTRADDVAIITLLQSGDDAECTRGVEQLLKRVGASVAAMLRRRYRISEDEIDQVLIATAYRVWSGAARFDTERGSLLALVRRIADNESVNLIRLRRLPRDETRIVSLTADLEAPEVQMAADELSAETRAVCAALQEIIAELPPMQRRVAEADMQHPECCVPARDLAEEIQTSPDAVYVHRNRYKETISKKMRSQGLMPA